MNCRSRKVGTGSREQDLIRDDITIFRTSCEHGRKDVYDALSMIGGGGRPAVQTDAFDFTGKESVGSFIPRISDVTSERYYIRDPCQRSAAGAWTDREPVQ
jgi:hypothetical protein